ncbi:MAG TPA: aldo/keto reductase [Paenirhodobacter sp.]
MEQSGLIRACQDQGMAFVSYGPLGSGHLLDDPVVADVARTQGRTAGQVILRWHLQQGLVAIPRSSNPDRVRENIAIADFTLSAADMARLSALAVPQGRIFHPEWVKSWD